MSVASTWSSVRAGVTGTPVTSGIGPGRSATISTRKGAGVIGVGSVGIDPTDDSTSCRPTSVDGIASGRATRLTRVGGRADTG